MDLNTGLVYVGVVVVSAAVILFVSMFGIKEKSYEEAIAEQRKLPEDHLLVAGKKDKGKDKKHKSKTGKRAKEKREDRDEKEDRSEPTAVRFDETPVVLPPEPPLTEISKGAKKKSKIEKVKPILVNKDEPPILAAATTVESTEPENPATDINHFDRIQPKDSLELIRSHSKETSSLQQCVQSEPMMNKSPKETPSKSKKSVKDAGKRKEEAREEKKETSVSQQQQNTKEMTKDATKEVVKEIAGTAVAACVSSPPSPVASAHTTVGCNAAGAATTKESKDPTIQVSSKETKKGKKKNDILAQIGGDRDGINVSLLMPLVQKAELSRSEIQILIDQLLNKQQDNPSEHSEWSEGRADPMIKLKKQLAEKEKSLVEEREASATYQNKLKELRAELNAERSRLTGHSKQLEEALNLKITEAQTLHTRMQHILESHAAEKQGFARQIEQLQAKVNEDASIIHKMQEEQGQTQVQVQQELIAQRKQLEVQFGQMRENENALKGQLAQKHIEIQELQNVNISVTQELQATCESSNAEIEMLRQQLGIMQDQFMHSEGQLQDFKEAGERMLDMARQLEESHRAHADFEHRLKSAHRHEQELQKQLHSLQAELKMAKAEANESSGLKSELNKVQSELMKIKGDLSLSRNEAETEAAEITKLRAALIASDKEVEVYRSENDKLVSAIRDEMNAAGSARAELAKAQYDFREETIERDNIVQQLTKATSKVAKLELELSTATANRAAKIENEAVQNGDGKKSDVQLRMTRLQEENDRISAQLVKFAEIEKDLKRLREENESLASQLAARTERPAVEGRENGVDDKLLEHSNLLQQKQNQLDDLRVELANRETELVQVRALVENLQTQVDKRSGAFERLENELEAQRSKNNELRTKNWKVMEALSAAESRTKTTSGQSIDEMVEKVKDDERNYTRSLLERIFPEVKVSEKSYERWLEAFEARIDEVLTELRMNGTNEESNELAKENLILQSVVHQCKQTINGTESMLTQIESRMVTQESKWESQLQQKEKEVTNLRIELVDLQKNLADNEAALQQEIRELEARLAEERETREQTEARVSALESKKRQWEQETRGRYDVKTEKLESIVDNTKSILASEQNVTLGGKKDQMSQEQNRDSRNNAEIVGVGITSDESTTNGPANTDSSKSELTRTTETLITELEKILPMKVDNDRDSLRKAARYVRSEGECEDGSFDSQSEINSKYCHTADHDTQASGNPLNGQHQKKHKKKRKSTVKPAKKRRRFAGWFRKKIMSRNKLR